MVHAQERAKKSTEKEFGEERKRNRDGGIFRSLLFSGRKSREKGE
jgi:hypothetical protein